VKTGASPPGQNRLMVPTGASDRARGGPIAYLTKAFPRASETFILDEILGLEAAGVDLRLYAVSHPSEAMVQPDVSKVASRVVYLRSAGRPSLARDVLPAVGAHLHLMVQHPRRYRQALAQLLRGADRRTAARHLVDAGRLATHLRRARARHIHASFAHTPASIAYYAHLLTGIPFSFAAHAKDLYRSNPQNLARRTREAELVLVCSTSAGQELTNRAGPAAPIVLAYHGVDTDRFKPTTVPLIDRLPRPELSILAVGRLVAKKGYPVLIEAIAEIRQTGCPVRCEIIGSGEKEVTLRQQIEHLGLARVVTLSAERSHQQLVSAYRNADVFAQTSVVLPDGDRDGIPNTLLEAMASGLAVVASDVAGIPEVVTDSITGLLVPAGDPVALAAALGRLAAEPDLRARVGAAARNQVVAHFDRRVCLQRTAVLLGALPPHTPRPAAHRAML